MINRVVLVGRITRDPDLKMTQSGISYVRFTVAVDRPFSSSQVGERQTDFVSCLAWRKNAEVFAKYNHKGSLIGVEGRIQTGQYVKDGVTNYTTEVLCEEIKLLEPRRSNEQQDRSNLNQSGYANNYREPVVPEDNKESDDFYSSSEKLSAEDDLPF